jgi:hypothetical protein
LFRGAGHYTFIISVAVWPGRFAAHEEFERRCKKFPSSFDSALSKSTIRKTTQEKDATYRIAMKSTPLGSTTNSQWSTVKTELNALANAIQAPGV